MNGLYRLAQLRDLETRALAALPAGTLMSRAATAIADAAQRLLLELPDLVSTANPPAAVTTCDVLVAAGPGNNGADALLAALLLQARGWSVRVAADAPGAALNQMLRDRCEQAGIPLGDLPSLTLNPPRCRLAIDGLFGIGQSRPLAGPHRRAVEVLNALKVPVLAVDVPSGLNADTGAILSDDTSAESPCCIRATETLTLLVDKPGLHTGAGIEQSGRVRFEALGWTSSTAVPATRTNNTNNTNAATAPTTNNGELFDSALALPLLPRRALNSHKGSHGSVAIIGGSPGMQGAALLAAAGAQAGGAGKVFIIAPQGSVFEATQAQWMSRAWQAPLEDIDAIAFGCGLGQSETVRAELVRCLGLALPMVIDADGLNQLAAAYRDGQPMNRHRAIILTPHPLEAARLMDLNTAQIQRDRISSALAIADRYQATVVLKGAGSVIADPSGRWSIIAAGAPTLATAGSGDVLGGLATALLAQGLNCWDAARLAAWAHGRAGELIQQQLPLGTGMAATELFGAIRTIMNGR